MEPNKRKRYTSYSSFVREKFGERVQKISINTGFSCPNRDGTKGIGGCTYCNTKSFNPDYCLSEKSISQQLKDGISFFNKKYKSQKYLAYFQAYTNTYSDLSLLKKMYTEAINYPNVVGLVIGTRPDCINTDIIDLLADIAKINYVALEFGVESTLNKTLELINRCHSYADTVKAYELSKDRGIHLGAHLIIGLPSESRDDILNHAKNISKLPIHTLKLHHLQIIKHTQMALDYKKNPSAFHLFNPDEYIDLMVDFLTLLRPDIIVERFTSESPKHLLIAPNWGGIKNYEIVANIEKRLLETNSWQGGAYINAN